jgi:hypothetical protein
MTLTFLIGVVICVIVLAFVCVWIYELRKGLSVFFRPPLESPSPSQDLRTNSPFPPPVAANQRLQTHGTPIDHGRIIKDSLLAALGIGLICCLAGATAEAQQNASDGGGGGGGGGDVEAQQGGAQAPMADMPQMSQGPQLGMDWPPVNSCCAGWCARLRDWRSWGLEYGNWKCWEGAELGGRAFWKRSRL